MRDTQLPALQPGRQASYLGQLGFIIIFKFNIHTLLLGILSFLLGILTKSPSSW